MPVSCPGQNTQGGFSLGITLDGLKGHYQNGTHPNQVTWLDSG